MPEIELVSATEARGVWAMNDWVDQPAFTLDGWGHYHERYVLEDGAWRIADERISRLRVVRTQKIPSAAPEAARAARPAAKKGKAAAAKARVAASSVRAKPRGKPAARNNRRGGKR
jgi:hypothetical protein